MSGLARARLAAPPDALAAAYTASLPVDRRLWREDLAGSAAHVRMLVRQGLLAPAEGEALLRGLQQVAAELEAGTFPFREDDEDIHLAVERRLTELLGPLGRKLHAGRSRNDQVALDLRLWLRGAVAEVRAAIHALQATLLRRAEEEVDTLLPGYTHLQRAQPVSLAHHLLAYFWMLARDDGRFADCLRRADESPLGAAALAGSGLPLDPQGVAAELGFARAFANSLDAVSDRDFAVEFVAAAALCQLHLSRLADELVLWSTAEFGFVELDDAFATGSSIMPQKKNPDVAELVRARTGRVYGALLGLLTVLKGLPLGYHRDLQEDKVHLFAAADTLLESLRVAEAMLRTLRFRRDRMRAALRGGLVATDLAEHLVRRGVPFREAYARVGRLARACAERGIDLEDLTPAELAAWLPEAGEEAAALLDPAAAVGRRETPGGTGPAAVRAQLARAHAHLAAAGAAAGTSADAGAAAGGGRAVAPAVGTEVGP